MGRRSRTRTKSVVPVRIFGTDAAGNNFYEVAHTLDISANGTRLAGVRVLLQVGDTIGVQHQHRKSQFEVVWVRRMAQGTEYQVGLRCLEPQKDVWNVKELTELSEADSFELRAGARSVGAERRAHPRHNVNAGAEVCLLGAQSGNWVVLTDASLSGCYCQTQKPLPMLTRIRVHMNFEGTEIAAYGVVRTSHPSIGMGIEFTEFGSADDRQRYLALLSDISDSEKKAAPMGAPKPDAAFIAQRMEAATEQLRNIEELLLCTDVDPTVLHDFREALGHVRTTAWAVQRWLESKARKDDTLPVISYLNKERVRIAIQLCHHLIEDLHGSPTESLEDEFDELLDTVEKLFRVLSRRQAGSQDEEAEHAESAGSGE